MKKEIITQNKIKIKILIIKNTQLVGLDHFS